MKAKLLLMLFLVSLSLGVFASEHHQKKPHAVSDWLSVEPSLSLGLVT